MSIVTVLQGLNNTYNPPSTWTSRDTLKAQNTVRDFLELIRNGQLRKSEHTKLVTAFVDWVEQDPFWEVALPVAPEFQEGEVQESLMTMFPKYNAQDIFHMEEIIKMVEERIHRSQQERLEMEKLNQEVRKSRDIELASPEWFEKLREKHGEDHGDGDDYASVLTSITTCADGSLCCGNEAEPGSCCAEGNGMFIENGKLVKSTSATSSAPAMPSSTTTISIQATSSSSASTTSTESASDSSSSNTGTIVGGVVAGVAGIAGIAALALAFWYFIIRRELQRQQILLNGYEDYQASKHEIWEEQPTETPKEVPANERRGELDTTQLRPELDSNSRHQNGVYT
ncbi:MAG: hypothetical protein Q9222_005612 [Ikaeria aurantiellina]